MERVSRDIVITVLSIVAVFWMVFAFLPISVTEILEYTVTIIVTEESYRHINATAYRVFSAFGLAFIGGLIFSIALYKAPLLHTAGRAILVIGLTIPAICWTAISVMIFGISDWTAIFAGAVIVLPVIATNLFDRLLSLDNDLIEVGKSFGLANHKIISSIVFPQIIPALFSSVRFGVTLSLKVIIIAELLGLSEGVGYRISYWFNLFDVEKVFSWTIVFVGIMLIVEYGVIAPLERRFTRWKSDGERKQ